MVLQHIVRLGAPIVLIACMAAPAVAKDKEAPPRPEGVVP